MKNIMQVTNSRYRLGYHVSAPAAWINDPNGFCYYKGYYHIFYQHHPYSADWGPMHWGHARSRDLVHWESLPIAIAPDTPEDEDGCFSGSAIVKDDVLYLIYTGHHYYGDNDPDHFWQNQNMAYSTDGIHFTKYEHNPIISAAPSDNTHHFRDPKVWEKDGFYYMILGSQAKDGLGRCIVYRSTDLKAWDYLGEMAKARNEKEEGFMWECPDFFSLQDGENVKDILLLSPQGIAAQKEKYLNLFQTGYFVGHYDYDTNKFSHGEFQELDFGHDFYATQTTLLSDGRRVVFGWMDMWESAFPEKADGWAGALTLPRELTLKENRLYMNPVAEVKELRTKQLAQWEKSLATPLLICENERQVEINLEILGQTDFELALRDSKGKACVTVQYKKDTQQFILTRAVDEADARYGTIAKSDIVKLRLFIDTSSLELFINDGETVFTERFYLEEAPSVWLAAEDTTLSCKNDSYQLTDQGIYFEK